MCPEVGKLKEIYSVADSRLASSTPSRASRVLDALHALDVPELLDVLHMLDSLGVLDALEVLGPPDINPMPEGVTYIIYI
jgi:hypothetical protein